MTQWTDPDYFKKQREKIGRHLMRALEISMNTGDIYSIGERITELVNDLELPAKRCSECSGIMTFFDWHLSQGMCNECAERISHEFEGKDNG